jgi:hypothetical protein
MCLAGRLSLMGSKDGNGVWRIAAHHPLMSKSALKSYTSVCRPTLRKLHGTMLP